MVQTSARLESKSAKGVVTESLINWLTDYQLQNIDQRSDGGQRVTLGF